jgi:Flp pilus assembly protein TadB
MHYAALDAYVLPQLFDKLCAELGEQRSQQLLKQHTTSVRRVSAANEEQQQQQVQVQGQEQEGSARQAAESKQQQQQQQQGNPHKRHAEAAHAECVGGTATVHGADTTGAAAAAAAAAAVEEACHPSKRQELAAAENTAAK